MLLVYDIETNGLIQEYTNMHCICVVDEFYQEYIFVDKSHIAQIKEIYPKAHVTVFKNFPKLLEKATELVCHNQLGFDLHILKKEFGITYHVDPSHINDMPIEIIDSLVESRWLYPDRPLPPGCPEYIKDYKNKTGKTKKIGAHGLEAWSMRVGGRKPAIEQWDGLPIEDYVFRCLEDVRNNVKTFFALMEEMGAMYSCGYLPWREIRKQAAFTIDYERFHAWEMDKQAHTGVRLDVEKAYALVEELDLKMANLLLEWDDKLPFIDIPFSRAKKDFNIPSKRFNKDQTLSKKMVEFLEKTGSTIDENRVLHIPNEGSFEYPWPATYRTKEKINFNSKAITQYLIDEFNWEPTFWNYKKDPKTNKLMKDENRQLIPISPALRDATTKEICPNLLEIDAPFVKALVLYRTLSHRRNTILSAKGTGKGYLGHPRLEKDGRLPAVLVPSSTNTRRGRHVFVANVPKADDKVIYGKEMRSLFLCDEGDYLLGYDCAGIEARLEAAACFCYDKGLKMHEILDGGDIHQRNADKFNVTRNQAKGIKYALLYGAGVGKAAKMLGKSFEEAKLFLEEWWSNDWAVKAVIDRLVEEYETSEQGWITAFDGSKLFIRSPHAAFNTFLQNGSTTVMKVSSQILYNKVRDLVDAGLVKKLIDYHDEAQWSVNKKLVKFKRVHSQDEANTYTNMGWSKMITTNNNNYVAYCELGDYAIKSIAEAGKVLKLDVPLSGDYLIGNNWKDCH